MMMNYLVLLAAAAGIFYIINLFAWALATKTFRASFFYLAFLYTATVFVTLAAWEFTKIALFMVLTQFGMQISLGLGFFGILFALADLIVWVFAYFIIPQNVLNRLGAHLATPLEIQRAVVMQIVILFVLMIINIVLRMVMKVEMMDYITQTVNSVSPAAAQEMPAGLD